MILQIVTALIEKLPRELPLYGHSVLNILETVLRSNDIAMVEETLPTFEMYCANQDLAVLAAEQRYASQYEGIVRSYAAFASSNSSIPSKSAATSLPTRLRWKNIGLKAIKSMVSSEGLSADGGKHLSCIVPVILENVYEDSEDLLDSLHRSAQTTEKSAPEQAKRRRASTVTVQTVDTAEGNVAEASGTTADADKAAEMEVRLLAIKCLERIFIVSSNRPQIRTAAGLVLQFIVSKDGSVKSQRTPQDHVAWAKSLMDIITKWCPVQDRFIVLFTAVEILRGISADGQPLDQQIVMASLIDSLLKSPVNMIGLSVIDVLVGFVQHILRLLQATLQSNQPADLNTHNEPKSTDGALQQDPMLTAEHVKLASLLKKCIADLATHIYYADQISDMIRTLLKRIRPLNPAETASAAMIKATSDPSASTYHIPSLAGERHAENYFYSAASQVVALEAIKDILVVANQKKTTSHPGIESRNRVGLQVWEGTQWLLRDSDRHVRNAYADAFVYWLQLETTKIDLKVPDQNSKLSRAQSKRGHDEHKRVAPSAPVDKAQNYISSVFLQLLHLALYETAIEYADVQEDILVVYLILVKLIEHLGVNAVRYGLPMVLKLQGELFNSVASQINIGSLVYGYLTALSEKFEFDTTRLGAAIQAETNRRKNSGTWLDMVQLPPLPLNQISLPANESLNQVALQEPLPKFTAVEDIVKQIEEAYVTSLAAAIQSPPGSPGKPITPSQSGYGFFEIGQNSPTLPADVKEDMLSSWSKEACVAILEKEKAKASSLAGSKNGNSIRRNHGGHLNGNGSYTPNDGGSPTSLGRNHHTAPGAGPGSSSSSQGYQRYTNRADGGSPRVSSRDSTIRVNDLKRMLTVTGNSNVRRSSPLRGRLDASNNSISTSSSESFVSGTFSASDFDMESRPQSVREGSETPKAASTAATTTAAFYGNDYDNDNIPPVPPLPSGLVIPGGFPDTSSTNLSRHNSSRSEGRSSASPNQVKSGSSVKGRSNGSATSAYLGRSLSGKRARSVNSLHRAAYPKASNQQDPSNASSGTEGIRLDIEKLLDGVLSHDDNDTSNGIDLSFVDQSVSQRRTSGGIGRPPY